MMLHRISKRGQCILKNLPVLIMKQQLVAAMRRTVIINENNVIDILNLYNQSITDNKNEDDESQFQGSLLDFSDEFLKDDSDMYADENAIFLPEEVADEVEDETANLFKESDRWKKNHNPSSMQEPQKSLDWFF